MLYKTGIIHVVETAVFAVANVVRGWQHCKEIMSISVALVSKEPVQIAQIQVCLSTSRRTMIIQES